MFPENGRKRKSRPKKQGVISILAVFFHSSHERRETPRTDQLQPLRFKRLLKFAIEDDARDGPRIVRRAGFRPSQAPTIDRANLRSGASCPGRIEPYVPSSRTDLSIVRVGYQLHGKATGKSLAGITQRATDLGFLTRRVFSNVRSTTGFAAADACPGDRGMRRDETSTADAAPARSQRAGRPRDVRGL